MKIPNKAVIRFEYNDEVKEYFFDRKELNDIIKEKQQRIDKAIEYIHLYTTQRKYFISYSDELKNEKPTFNGDVRKLLNILKGSDKE